MLDTWHLTEEETTKLHESNKLPRQAIEKTQQARQQGYEVFAIGNPQDGKIIAVMGYSTKGAASGELPRVLTEVQS